VSANKQALPPYFHLAAVRADSVPFAALYPSMGESVEGTLGNVNSRSGSVALITAGVIALILGGVWVGQGMNLIPGSFMTGSRMWLSIGLIVTVVGIILIVLGLRRPGHGRTTR